MKGVVGERKNKNPVIGSGRGFGRGMCEREQDIISIVQNAQKYTPPFVQNSQK
jgi:hypothetical protein